MQLLRGRERSSRGARARADRRRVSVLAGDVRLLGEGAVEELADASRAAGGRGAQPPRCSEAALERLADGEFDLFGLAAGFERVDDRALRACHRYTGDPPDVLGGRRLLEGVEADAGAGALAAFGARQRDVDCIGEITSESS